MAQQDTKQSLITQSSKIPGLALTGYAQTGKDDLTAALVTQGWVALPFSSGIKAFFEDFLQGRETVKETVARLRKVNKMLGEDQIDWLIRNILQPYQEAGHQISAFTEVREEKQYIRGLLQYGGDVIYDYAYQIYFRKLDEHLKTGQKVVNSRVMRLQEAQGFLMRHIPIVMITRKNWPPISQWEQNNIEMLIRAGYPSGILENNGTHEQWLEECRKLAFTLKYK